MNKDNKLRWIDTSAMICDPLTKYGNELFASRLVETMETGRLDLVATASSELKKMRQHNIRLNRIDNNDLNEL